jgi:hypothetical protein
MKCNLESERAMEKQMRSQPESDAPLQVQGFSLRELVRAQEKAFQLDLTGSGSPKRRKSKRGAERTDQAERETA